MYFNHAFRKCFVGTKYGSGGQDEGIFTEAYDGVTNQLTQAGIDYGFITSQYMDDDGSNTLIHTSDLQNAAMGPGTFAFFDPTTYNIVDVSALDGCCPLVLASASIRLNDKLTPNTFHGGYQESNKSKLINPKYVRQYYRVDSCVPQQSVISIGTTPYTAALNPADASCCKEYLCGETYYLRVDIKDSPVLRALNHNGYLNLDYYTGCCADETPVPVDPTLVYLGWAKQIVDDPRFKDFVAPVVFDYTGTPWYAPGTTVTLDGTATAVTPAEWWGPLPNATAAEIAASPGYEASVAGLGWAAAYAGDPTAACTAGMRLYGAYVETTFGNCSFQTTDHYETEPLQIYASLVDYTGDPCIFEGVCVYTECAGLTGQGFGETVLRDVILSESYLQNFRHDDARIREITGGDDIHAVISRTTMYTRYFLEHSVPRFNNPTGTFDNDRYLLDIVTRGQSASLETYLETWLVTNCESCEALGEHTCTPCEIDPDTPDPV